MVKARENRFLFLSLGIVFSVFSAVLVVLTLLFLKNADYASMVVTFIASAVFIYAIPFSFFAAADAKALIRFIPIYKANLALPYEQAIIKISEELGWKTKATEKLLKKAIKKKYV